MFSRHTITARKAVRQRTLFCAGGLTAKNPCATSVTATCSLYIANNSAGVFEASSGQQPPKAALNSGAAKSPCSGAVAASDAILADATVCAMMRFCTGDMRGGTAGATEPAGTDTREPSTTAATHATATAHARAIAMVALITVVTAQARRVVLGSQKPTALAAVGGRGGPGIARTAMSLQFIGPLSAIGALVVEKAGGGGGRRRGEPTPLPSSSSLVLASLADAPALHPSLVASVGLAAQ